MTLGIMISIVILSFTNKPFMLSVIMLNVVLLSVIRLNVVMPIVVMLKVVAPLLLTCHII